MSEWLDIMLDEIERKQAEEQAALEERVLRRQDSPAGESQAPASSGEA